MQGQGRRLVDEDLGVGQRLAAELELLELPLAERPGPDAPDVELASAQSIRMTIDSLDISIEKKPTARSVFSPTYWEMFRQRAVLPIDGRAATMTSSDLWKPAVRLSRSAGSPWARR